MAELKSLAKDTAIYGASSIIGKFLNYFLVPIYTFSLPAASGGYGVITKMYANNHYYSRSFGCLFRERQGSFGYCGTVCTDSLTYFSDINS